MCHRHGCATEQAPLHVAVILSTLGWICNFTDLHSIIHRVHVKACLLILIIKVRGDDARTDCEASWAYRLPGHACASNLVVVQQTTTISNHSIASTVLGLLNLHLVIYMSSSIRPQILLGKLAQRCLANVLESF